LIVDDNPDAASTLSQLLALDGYVVLTAGGGEEALLMAAQHLPHCVLLDIGMPGMNGLELTRRLRHQYGDDIVLVAITGAAPGDKVADGTFVLVDHYLHKPVQPAQLRRILRPL
jgi:CheY-like chemotaxis protein